jgi:hypothetical protein
MDNAAHLVIAGSNIEESRVHHWKGYSVRDGKLICCNVFSCLVAIFPQGNVDDVLKLQESYSNVWARTRGRHGTS